MPAQRQGLGSSSFQSEKTEAESSTADLRESKERPSEESEIEGIGLRRKKKKKKKKNRMAVGGRERIQRVKGDEGCREKG